MDLLRLEIHPCLRKIQQSHSAKKDDLIQPGKIAIVYLHNKYRAEYLEYYQLRPLTGELHLLTTEAYDPEKDCGYDGQLPSKIPPKQAPQYNPAPDDEEPRVKAIDECKIRLMVVYTNTVDDLSPNIADLIELEVDNFNDINANSDVDFQVELARSREVNYTETDEELQHPDVAGWDVSRDLYRLWHPSDGWMDDLHAERNLYDADMVVFMVDDLSGYDGGRFSEHHQQQIRFSEYLCVQSRIGQH